MRLAKLRPSPRAATSLRSGALSILADSEGATQTTVITRISPSYKNSIKMRWTSGSDRGTAQEPAVAAVALERRASRGQPGGHVSRNLRADLGQHAGVVGVELG